MLEERPITPLPPSPRSNQVTPLATPSVIPFVEHTANVDEVRPATAISISPAAGVQNTELTTEKAIPTADPFLHAEKFEFSYPPVSSDGNRLQRRTRPTLRHLACGCTEMGCGRLCSMLSCIVILMVFAVIMAVIFWVRIPQVNVNGVQVSAAGLVFSADGFSLGFTINFTIYNPNYIGADFPNITAEAFYPTLPTAPLGEGNLTNVYIAARSTTPLLFPITANYSQSADPTGLILTDLENRCGIFGTPRQPVTINYVIKAACKVGAVTVQLPDYSSSTSFDCPAQPTQT